MLESQSRKFIHDVRAFCKKDPTYPPDAYGFLADAFNTTTDLRKQESLNADMDISAEILLQGIKKYALEQFGPLTFHVLSEWNIHTTMDFGNMVFNLVKIGWFGKSDEDSIADFLNVFSFEDAFVKPFQAPPPKK